MFKFLILLPFLFSCGTKGENPKIERGSMTAPEWAAKKYEFYNENYIHNDQFHIDLGDCDIVSHAGFFSMVESRVDLRPMIDDEDKLWRSVDRGCDTDPSKDAVLGFATWAYHTGSQDDLTRVAARWAENSWLTGPRGPWSVIFITFNIRNTIGLILDDETYQGYPEVWTGGQTGFRANLEIQHISLRGEIEGHVSDKQLEILEENYNRNPGNCLYGWALYQFGNAPRAYENCMETLANDGLFPPDRLPTRRKDRCAEWLWERERIDWKVRDDANGCNDPGDDIHHGADYVFAYRLWHGN